MMNSHLVTPHPNPLPAGAGRGGIFPTRFSQGIAVVLALAGVLMLAACASGYTRVRDIKAAPDGFVGKEVRLQGTVGKAIDPPRPQAYVLRDGSGEIMVVTRGELPAQDSEVALRGIVRITVDRGARWSLDVRVEETERLR
jgi:uncharacterized protein YdeI (BOF family)